MAEELRKMDRAPEEFEAELAALLSKWEWDTGYAKTSAELLASHVVTCLLLYDCAVCDRDTALKTQ